MEQVLPPRGQSVMGANNEPRSVGDIYLSPVTSRHYDTLKVWRQLAARNVNKQTEDQLIPTIREVFGLPEIDAADGSGFTDEVTILEFEKFKEYVRGKASRGEPSRKCAPCMASPVS